MLLVGLMVFEFDCSTLRSLMSALLRGWSSVRMNREGVCPQEKSAEGMNLCGWRTNDLLDHVFLLLVREVCCLSNLLEYALS